jgi:hypothetical protein
VFARHVALKVLLSLRREVYVTQQKESAVIVKYTAANTPKELNPSIQHHPPVANEMHIDKQADLTADWTFKGFVIAVTAHMAPKVLLPFRRKVCRIA